jgi:hypothetical protein
VTFSARAAAFLFIAVMPGRLFADESYSNLPFEKLLNLAVCAEMKTMGRDCETDTKPSDERSRALVTGLEDLWAMNYGEKTLRKINETSRMLRSWARFDLGVLIKNPEFARATLLRGEAGIKYLLEKDQSDPSHDRLRLTEVSRKKSGEWVRKAERSFAAGKFDLMRHQLYQALWLSDPVTSLEPMANPVEVGGLAAKNFPEFNS